MFLRSELPSLLLLLPAEEDEELLPDKDAAWLVALVLPPEGDEDVELEDVVSDVLLPDLIVVADNVML